MIDSNGRRRGGVWVAVAVTGVLAALIAGCGGGSGDGAGTSANKADKEDALTVSLILEGPKNDKAFNEAAYRGVKQAIAEHPNLEFKSVLENRHTTQEQTDAIETLAPISDVVIGTGAQFGPIYDATASRFPDTTFLTIGGYPRQHHDNVYSLAFDRVAASQAAVLAAKLTKAKKVAFIGGGDIPPTNQSLIGVKAALADIDPSIRVLANIVGDFNDVPKAKAAAAAVLADGADVIIGYVDAGIAGVYAAAKESGKDVPVFKLDLLECKAYPNIVGANIGDNTAATKTLLSGIAEGTLEPKGVTIFAGLEDPSLQRLDLCPRYANDKAFAKLSEQTRKAIVSGEMALPAEQLNPRPDYPYRDGVDGELQHAG